MSYRSAHLFFEDLRSSKSSTPFNPPPKEGGNNTWLHPFQHSWVGEDNSDKNNYRNIYAHNMSLYLMNYSSQIPLTSTCKKSYFLGIYPFTPFWKEFYFAEQRAFPPSMEGELKGVGDSYTTYIQKHQYVMPLINKRSKDV